jgi:hypothetical protein
MAALRVCVHVCVLKICPILGSLAFDVQLFPISNTKPF